MQMNCPILMTAFRNLRSLESIKDPLDRRLKQELLQENTGIIERIMEGLKNSGRWIGFTGCSTRSEQYGAQHQPHFG
jgi:hypothetical protein